MPTLSRSLIAKTPALVVAGWLSAATADPVSLVVRCSEAPIQYRLQQVATQDLERRGHKVVTDSSAIIQIRAVCAPVRAEGAASNPTPKPPPLGFALALVIAKKATGGGWDTVHLSNHFYPLDRYDDAVAKSLRDVSF